MSAAAELCWDTPAFTDSAERVSILGYPVPDRGPVFIDINTGAAKLSVSCVTRISNPFRWFHFESRPKNAAGTTLPDWLYAGFTVESVSSHALADHHCERPFPLDINRAVRSSAYSVHATSTSRASAGVLARYAEVTPVRAITQLKQIADDMILVQLHDVRRDAVIANEIVCSRVTAIKIRQQCCVGALLWCVPVNQLATETGTAAVIPRVTA